MKLNLKNKKNLAKVIAILSLSAFIASTVLLVFFMGTNAYYLEKDNYREHLQQEVVSSQVQSLVYRNFYQGEYKGHDGQKQNFTLSLYEDNDLLYEEPTDEKIERTLSETVVVDDEFEPNQYRERILRAEINILENKPVDDNLKLFSTYSDTLYEIRYVVLYSMVLSGLVFLLSMLSLLKKEAGTVAAFNRLDKIPFDLYSFFMIPMLFFPAILLENIDYGMQIKNVHLFLFFSALTMVVFSTLLIEYFKSIVVRIQTKTLFKNNLFVMILSKIVGIAKSFTSRILFMIQNLKYSRKQIVIFTLFLLLQIIILAIFSGFSIVIYAVEVLGIYYYLVNEGVQWDALITKSSAIASGNLNHQETVNFQRKFAKVNENLEAVEAGLSLAVEKQMKSEMMKTELITNVSHDLKTPLTSIINYLDLLKDADEADKEDYLAILQRQSYKLKGLIEDLLEVSKLNSGNYNVNLSAVDLTLLLTQVEGEYQEKFKEHDLTLIVNKPENPLMIEADGQLLWRIFDNLLQNALNYSLAHSRVYVDLKHQNNHIIVSIKNISHEPLNYDAKTLMERFVREDESRNSEGSGLGLAIVKGMMEAQGFDFVIQLDADLFTSQLIFKQ
ncbi:MAG TPA: HAMP domain-containing sensor histidine kinase [Erysipelothrix sp.]